MERYFYVFINYQQGDWLGKLAIAEFAANNNKSASIKLSPFFATKGLHPHISFDRIDFSNASTCE